MELTRLDTTMKLLQKVLDLRSENQRIISSNIANAETPGYAPATMTFESQLHDVLHGPSLRPVRTNPGHIAVSPSNLDQVTGTITRTPDRTGIGDENGVSVEQEMMKLSENQLLYEAAVTMLNKKLAILKYTANNGK
ncbi:flagellar basal body rod protein FlgB [Desulfolithobacter sp.]